MNKGQTKNKKCDKKLVPLNIGLPSKLKENFVQGKHAFKGKNT
jgi:hypothetical protein